MSNLRKLFKSGNSTVLSIPDYLLKEMGIKAGDFVTIDPIRVKNLKFISVNVRATQPKKQK